MSEPIVFISTLKIQEEKLTEFQEGVKKSMTFLEENGPQVLVEVYIDTENMIAHGIQIHRDSESILTHWKINNANMREVMQYTVTTNVDIYGEPNDAVMEGMHRLASTGATINAYAHFAGFHRF